MKRVSLSGIVMIIWALWLGGLAALFMIVTRLFKEHNDIFHLAVPTIFQMFEQYQVVIAAAALFVSFIWFVVEKRTSRMLMFIIFALCAAGSVTNALVITPRMEKIRLAGGSGSPAFMSLHGKSMVIYLGELVLLIVGSWVIAKGSASGTRN